MLTETDAAIIAWLRPLILDLRDRVDDVPDGPWQVRDDIHEITSAGNGARSGIGYPQTIKQVLDGTNAEASPTICETFDAPGQPLIMGPYLVRVADPLHVRAMADSWLAQLGLCHRLIAATSDGPDDPVVAAVRRTETEMGRQWLRLLAAAFKTFPGYDARWAPDGNPQIGGARPWTAADQARRWPDTETAELAAPAS
jgi:hypothetical protein